MVGGFRCVGGRRGIQGLGDVGENKGAGRGRQGLGNVSVYVKGGQ